MSNILANSYHMASVLCKKASPCIASVVKQFSAAISTGTYAGVTFGALSFFFLISYQQNLSITTLCKINLLCSSVHSVSTQLKHASCNIFVDVHLATY